MSGADVGNVAASLCKGSSISGVCVYDALDVGECTIKDEMSRCVARWIEGAFDNLAGLEIDNNHVIDFHNVVVNARRLDDNEPFFTIDARDIAPGVDNEPLTDKFHVGFEDLFL